MTQYEKKEPNRMIRIFNLLDKLALTSIHLVRTSFIVFESFNMPFPSVAVKRVRYTPLATS